MRTNSNLKILRSRNWGEIIALYLYKAITNKNPNIIPMESDFSSPHFLSVGSVLRMCNKHTVVWGSGFISKDDALGLFDWRKTNSECYMVPKKITAVRGPLTQKKLERMGVGCKPVFGDPALLLPLFYNPKREKKYKIGVIPHYIERKDERLKIFKNMDGVKIINILQNRFRYHLNMLDYFTFIDNINQCEKIISSSLHGVIVADAYNIPSYWLKLSNKVTGEGFKFYDHFGAVNRSRQDFITINNEMKIEQLEKKLYSYSNLYDANKLLDVCPFA